VRLTDIPIGLANFIGLFYRHYGADLTQLLKYLVHQLYNRQTSEIIVLRELIEKMASIQPLPTLSEELITAMAGGPVLRIEAIAPATRGAMRELNDAVTKSTLRRLGKALTDTGLALPLLIQVAQQRQACVYQTSNVELKALANLYDEVWFPTAHQRLLLISTLCADARGVVPISGASYFARHNVPR
jgi:THO complex subunit 2